jgi:hypothetical protein
VPAPLSVAGGGGGEVGVGVVGEVEPSPLEALESVAGCVAVADPLFAAGGCGGLVVVIPLRRSVIS